MPPVIDSTLGSRFWITSDLRQLDGFFGPDDVSSKEGQPVDELAPQVSDEDVGRIIGDDSGLTSLVAGADSNRFKSTFCRAKLLGSSMGAENGAVGELIKSGSDETCSKLGISFDAMARKIARLNRIYLPVDRREKGDLTEAELDTARTALTKMVLSREFYTRAELDRPLDHKGCLALANATLGLMKLVDDGKMSFDQINDFLMGEIIDLNKPADILRLAVKTAQKARETFVDRPGVEKVLRQVDELMARFPYSGQLKALKDLIAAKAGELLAMREELSKKLDVSGDIDDGSKDAIDAKLRSVANDLRAFRYDLERANGTAMKPMECLRRFFDDISLRGEHRAHNAEHRVTRERYDGLVGLENELKGLLRTAFDEVSGLLDTDEEFRSVSRIDLSFRSVADTSKEACGMTHATNNHVRYYFSGAESKKERFAKEVHEMFDPIVKSGGRKKVVFEAGVDVRGGIDLGKSVVMDARAGAKYLQTAEIKVAKGGGEIEVTYFDGGIAEASAEAAVKAPGEVGPGNVRSGVDVHAGANIGGGRGRTVRYPSLDAFIADCHGSSTLTDTSMKNTALCLGKIGQAVRAFCRGVKDIVTALGFRIHKSVSDNNAYRAMLVDKGIVNELDDILSPPGANAAKTGERTYDAMQWGSDVGTDVSFKVHTGYDSEGEEKTGSLFDLGVDARYSGEWQRRVHGEEYRSRLNSLRLQSEPFLRGLDVVDRPEDEGVQADIDGLNVDLDAEALKRVCGKIAKALDDRLRKLEDKAVRLRPDDTETWSRACDEINRLTVLYVRFERRLTEIAQTGDEEVRPQAEELLKTASSLFTKRLTTPSMDIPEKVFKEKLVDVVTSDSRAKTVHTAQLKISYSAGGVLTDIAKDAAPGLQGDSLGKTMGKTAVETLTNTAMSTVGAAGSVKGYVSVEEYSEEDSRPWKNGKAVVCGIKFEPNLPVRVIVDSIAKMCIDSLTDVDPKELPSVRKQVVSDVLASLLPGMVVGELVTVYGSLTLGQVLLKGAEAGGAAKFFAGPLLKAVTGVIPLQGLEAGFDSEFGANLEFRFERGRLACFSVSEEASMSQTLGVRFQAGPVGVGAHIKSGFEESTVERYIYAHPSVDTTLGRAAEFLRSGGRTALNQFLTHNKVGTLRLFDAALIAQGAQGVSENPKDANLRSDVLDWQIRLSRSQSYFKAMMQPGVPPAIRDRANSLNQELARLTALLQGPGAVTRQSPEHERIQYMEDLLVLVASAYELKNEYNAARKLTAEAWKAEETAFEREEVDFDLDESDIDALNMSVIDDTDFD